MINRVRDGKRYFKPQQKISFAEWEDIHERAAFSKAFFRSGNSVRELMEINLKEVEDMILENRIKEVHEEHTMSDVLKKIFITSRQVQVDEVTGQLKYIRSFLAEIKSWMDFEAELLRLEASGKISIERNTEKNDAK